MLMLNKRFRLLQQEEMNKSKSSVFHRVFARHYCVSNSRDHIVLIEMLPQII